MKLKDTSGTQALALFVIFITLAASASFATALFMKMNLGIGYQVLYYSLIFVYHVTLIIGLFLVDTDDDKPKQQEMVFE